MSSISRIRVVTSTQSAARDAAAIAAGIPSRALMQRAGAAAASEIALRYPDALARGALIFAGPGNNGGDAWVVARALAASGIPVRVSEAGEARTTDAQAERALAGIALRGDATYRGEGIVIDGLLGTGASGAPRGAIPDAIAAIAEARSHGAIVVALDLPSGIDASTGEAALSVHADLTITFGTVKRGHLLRRDRCGVIVCVDIGLGEFAELDDGASLLADARWVASRIPAIGASAHKGERRKLAIVGGAEGMAGASILAARAALRSGIGMVRVVADTPSLPAVQQAEPLALASAWTADDATLRREVLEWADALVIGPGLGKSGEARALLERLLQEFRGPLVLDADALNLIAEARATLGSLVAGRQALLTPHAAEFARLAGNDATQVLAHPFDEGARLALELKATILLKGVPTIVSAPDGRSCASAAGTPVLAAAGSGDILSGIAGTLVAQIDDVFDAGVCAAWIHGRMAELATRSGADRRRVRGMTLDDVLAVLGESWSFDVAPARYPVLLELAAVGEA